MGAGTDAERQHSLALATSDDGGALWQRHGPVLQPSDKGGWDDGAVARPCLVPPESEDAPARLYYLGRSADGARQGIGVAESVDAEWRTWRRVGT